MKHEPYGPDYMVGAWVALLRYLLGKEQARNDFKAETGIDIQSVVNARSLNKLIDEATGFTKDAVIKWADWVTVNHWGEY